MFKKALTRIRELSDSIKELFQILRIISNLAFKH
jgi:hypothetical protein